MRRAYMTTSGADLCVVLRASDAEGTLHLFHPSIQQLHPPTFHRTTSTTYLPSIQASTSCTPFGKWCSLPDAASALPWFCDPSSYMQQHQDLVTEFLG